MWERTRQRLVGKGRCPCGDYIRKGGREKRRGKRGKKSHSDAAKEFAEQMTTYWNAAKDGLRHAQEVMQSVYNRTKRAPIKYQVGDKVMLDARHLKLHRPSSKLSEKSLGPFEILSKEGHSAYH